MAPVTVTLSLISHTNAGKTTLARTLLRRDVGHVRDQAHVTDEASAHVLVEADGAVLRLCDTPGFGDTARLMRRLRGENDPLGWFLAQIWDRFVDRAMWCNREAVRNVREEADVVLYLVNAAERPDAAGYVPIELELLGWIGRPVLVLLNQVGVGGADLVARWRRAVAGHPVVRDVLSLDAFTRVWAEEDVLLRRVAEVLGGAEHDAMTRLLAAWNARNEATFRHACARMGAYLARAAVDREALAATRGEGLLESITGALRVSAMGRRGAMRVLSERLDEATGTLMAGLIADHGLVGESARQIERRMQDYQVSGVTALDEKSGALAGAVVSGALGGLAADALAGGLTLGGGMIAGGILGALGGSALARGFRMVGGVTDPSVRWSGEFLDQLSRQVVMRYLAVAHFGRGRGRYEDLDQPARWTSLVDRSFARESERMAALWKQADSADASQLEAETTGWVTEMVLDVLRTAYPEAHLPAR